MKRILVVAALAMFSLALLADHATVNTADSDSIASYMPGVSLPSVQLDEILLVAPAPAAVPRTFVRRAPLVEPTAVRSDEARFRRPSPEVAMALLARRLYFTGKHLRPLG